MPERDSREHSPVARRAGQVTRQTCRQSHIPTEKGQTVRDDDQHAASRFRRRFTPEEANALLPDLIPLLVTLRSNRAAALAVQHSLDALTPAMRSNGAGRRAAELEQELRRLALRIAAGVRRLTRLGVEIKDLDHGLIDFPSDRDGRVVSLCWRLGEDRVAFWHELDGGYRGRQPL